MDMNEEHLFLFEVEKSASGASWIAPNKPKKNIKNLLIQILIQ